MASISATTAAIIAASASLAAAGVTAYSSVAAGQSQEKAAEYNAEMQRRQAQDSLQRGAIEAAAKQDRARKIASQQAEGMALSGVAIDSGTPLALLTETAGLGELDKLRTLNNARRMAWGYGAQAELDIFQGNAAARAGYLNAGGTFLGAAASAAGYYGGAVSKGGGSAGGGAGGGGHAGH